MKLIKLIIISLLFTSVSFAKTFKIKDVRVEGLQRITVGSFFNYLPVSIGDKVSDRGFSKIIKRLYKTKFFDDISLAEDKGVLVVRVVERPIVNNVTIDGNKEIGSKDLKNGLRDMGLSAGEPFNKMLLNHVEKELLKIYHSRSKYDVVIKTDIESLVDNRVNLKIDIKEGISARIKQINIVGNKAFSEKILLKKLKLTTTRWHSLMTKHDRYSGAALKSDIKTISNFYLNRGFLDYKLVSTQVSLTDDKKGVYITININEGLPYKLVSYSFSENNLVKKEDLEKAVLIKNNTYLSRKKLIVSKERINLEYRTLGYAFSETLTDLDINKEKHEVKVNFVTSLGKKVNVRRVSFTGNNKTNDEVLRREMRQMEASPYNARKVNRSAQRIQRLKHIAKVTRKEVPVAGNHDQVDIVYNVAENSTRNIDLGVGYGTSSGLILKAGYETANFFGTGNEFRFDFSASGSSKNFSANFTDPYWTENGISRTYSLFYSKTDRKKEDIGDWASDRWGAFMRFGVPISEYEAFSIGGGYRGIKIETGKNVSREIAGFLKKEDKETFHEFVLDFGWTHDTRNKGFFATKGTLNNISAEIVLPGSSVSYYKIGVKNRSYFPLHEKLILSPHIEINYADGFGDTDDLPFYRHYYAGGLRTVRGFRGNSLGPKFSNGNIAGGDFRITGGIEALFPLKVGSDTENVRLGAFVDFGNVYSDYSTFDADDFRYSAGVSLLWNSPIGPLNLSYGVPLNEKKGDVEERFQFTIGVPF